MNKTTIDDQTLDDLVTGNLLGERYRQALLAIDARPHLWRKCALAFLREQALQQDMKALTQGSIDWTQAAADDECQPAGVELAKEDTEDGVSSRGLLQRMGTLAALLLVSFTVGWLGAGLRIGDTNLDGSAVEQASLMGRQGLSASGNQNPLRSADRSNGSVPSEALWNGTQTATVFLGDQPTPLNWDLPPELRRMEEMGWVRIESFDAFMPVSLPDGTSAIVPIRQLRVIPELHSY
jgi:hypothetical protein